MGAQEFQKILANLIRHPTISLEETRAKLGSPPLTAKEESQLRSMSRDPLVMKFGYKMSLCRRRDATEIMKLSKDFIAPEILDEMYYRYFEPSRSSTDFVMLGVQFLEFALSDSACQDLIKECPPFVQDLMVYDLTKAEVLRKVIHLENQALPRESLLVNNTFRIIELNYDVPAIDQMKVQNPESKKSPAQKKATVLFMAVPVPPYYRMFQIDESVTVFLNAQRRNPREWHGELPKPFKAMVKVGLCRDLTFVDREGMI